jgi:hypothetical protein
MTALKDRNPLSHDLAATGTTGLTVCHYSGYLSSLYFGATPTSTLLLATSPAIIVTMHSCRAEYRSDLQEVTESKDAGRIHVRSSRGFSPNVCAENTA